MGAKKEKKSQGEKIGIRDGRKLGEKGKKDIKTKLVESFLLGKRREGGRTET